MALIRCKECGNEVSSKAETCPKCGARVKRKSLGCASLIGVLLLFSVIIGVIGSIVQNDAEQQKPPLTAQQKAEKTKADDATARAAAGAKLLKQSMRDPASFKLESALVIAGTDAVCYEYRAKNGFGGTNVGRAVLAPDGKTFKTNEMDGFTQLWNKECANKPGTDAATAINWLVL